jgi:hypothetical protein
MPPDSVNLLTAIRKDGAKEVLTNNPAIALPMANAMTTAQNPPMVSVVLILLPDQDLKEEEDHPVTFQTANVHIRQEVREKTNPDLKNEKGATEKDQPSVKEVADHPVIFQMESVRTHPEHQEKEETDQPSVKEAVDHREIFQMENVRIRQEDQEKTNPDLKSGKVETEKDPPSVKEVLDRPAIFQMVNVLTHQEARE